MIDYDNNGELKKAAQCLPVNLGTAVGVYGCALFILAHLHSCDVQRCQVVHKMRRVVFSKIARVYRQIGNRYGQ